MFRLGGAGALLCVAGCTTPAPKPAVPDFFPRPPAAPRLQYLTSISAPRDVEPPPHPFRRFVFGTLPEKQGLKKPYGIEFAGGVLTVCDTGLSGLHRIDLKNRVWSYFRPGGMGALQTPLHSARAPNGNLYVADAQRRQLVMYDPEGRFAGSMGGITPTALKIRGDRLYALDKESAQVRVYALADGNLLRVFPSPGTPPEQRLYLPTNLDIGSDGSVYVSDSGAFCVQRYDARGRFLRRYGGQGMAPGLFSRNKGVAVDREGRLYVVDAAFQNLQVFAPDGSLLLFMGDPDPQGGAMVLPAGILIDYEHVDLFQRYAASGRSLEYLVLVTSQYGPHKINVYGFLAPDE